MRVNAPDADALSILLPSGNGNATQINILEGNIIDPQFGLGGNGSNTSHNWTIAKILFGLGNKSTAGKSGGGIFGPIALGGANGNGNVTQINILSYNIFNPQVSLNGNNTSQNTTISNVSLDNGNDSKATSATGTGAGTFIGGATGNGNTTQLAFFSGNIFNPQFSLFGSNTSNNTAITNIAGLNGNRSVTNATSGGFFGTGLFGMTGNGNTDQTAVGVSNIINPQFSLLGTNLSRNYANANQATGNGGGAGNSVSSAGGLGNIFGVGETGNGDTTQNATGSGNIYNDQWRLGMGNFLSPAPAAPVVTPQTQDALTNDQVTSTSNGQPGLSEKELLELEGKQQGTTSSTGITGAPEPVEGRRRPAQERG